MAVADPALFGTPFSEFHLRPADFNALLARSGTPADLRYATPCACGNARIGENDPGCQLCFPYGVIWDPAVRWQVFGPNRKPTFRIDAAGSYEIGDVYFTLPTECVPPLLSRITLPLSILRLTDTLVKGQQDIIRYPTVLEVETAHIVQRVPPTGDPYDTVTVPLVLGTDVVVNGRQLVWPPGSSIPDGTTVSVRFTGCVEYGVWEVQDRNEGGNQLPYRALCKRLDYYLHPRGPMQPPLSYVAGGTP